jgi:hypothetical protein
LCDRSSAQAEGVKECTLRIGDHCDIAPVLVEECIPVRLTALMDEDDARYKGLLLARTAQVGDPLAREQSPTMPQEHQPSRHLQDLAKSRGLTELSPLNGLVQ